MFRPRYFGESYLITIGNFILDTSFGSTKSLIAEDNFSLCDIDQLVAVGGGMSEISKFHSWCFSNMGVFGCL